MNILGCIASYWIRFPLVVRAIWLVLLLILGSVVVWGQEPARVAAGHESDDKIPQRCYWLKSYWLSQAMITLLASCAGFVLQAWRDVPTFTFTVARLMHVETGVSPVFPLVFLLIAACAWAYAGIRRRYIFYQHTLSRHRENPDTSEHKKRHKKQDDAPNWVDRLLSDYYDTIEELEKIVREPLHLFSRRRVPVLIAVASVVCLYWLGPVSSQPSTLIDPEFDSLFVVALVVMSSVLIFHAVYLFYVCACSTDCSTCSCVSDHRCARSFTRAVFAVVLERAGRQPWFGCSASMRGSDLQIPRSASEVLDGQSFSRHLSGPRPETTPQ